MELRLQLVLEYERIYVRKYIPKYKGTKIRKYENIKVLFPKLSVYSGVFSTYNIYEFL